MGEAFYSSVTCLLHLSLSIMSIITVRPRTDWNVGITLGWQLFNYRFIE
jgi:hypothetical protein